MGQVERAAEEADGQEMDSRAAEYVTDGLGGDVNDLRWIGLARARELHAADGAIWIDVRDTTEVKGQGTIPGAWSVPMHGVFHDGIVSALARARCPHRPRTQTSDGLIAEILKNRRHQPIIIFSAVATPFSKCRAFCRLILRAGHRRLSPQRF